MRTHKHYAMAPWRIEAALGDQLAAEVAKAGKTRNACLEEAVALWLESRGVEDVAWPPGSELRGAAPRRKPKVDPEAARLAEERKAEKARQEEARRMQARADYEARLAAWRAKEAAEKAANEGKEEI